MLDQRRRRWADIKTSLFQRVVFAGKIHLILVGRWWAIDNVGRSGQPYSGITNLYQTNKQTNKQTSKQTNKQTNKQANKQTNKQTTEGAFLFNLIFEVLKLAPLSSWPSLWATT